jgi:hypothetical protein
MPSRRNLIHLRGILSFILLSLLANALLVANGLAADGNEKIIFLHHSTGGAVYAQGEVDNWIGAYNADNGTAYQIEERAYPNSPYPWSNYPYDYWNLWLNGACDNAQAGIACMDSLARDYDVVIFKHCFPGAGVLEDTGTPDIASPRKSLENYKLQYRALRDLMDSYTGTQFIVWTLAPLHRLATSTSNAGRARDFVDWVRSDWLSEDGRSHPNIAIFDFWGYAAEENDGTSTGQGPVNTLRYEYEKSHNNSDSHPNTQANEIIGPHFAEFIVNTIEETTSDDDGGDDTSGDGDQGGDDTGGDDTSSDDTSGDDTSGDDTSGDDTSGDDNQGGNDSGDTTSDEAKDLGGDNGDGSSFGNGCFLTLMTP